MAYRSLVVSVVAVGVLALGGGSAAHAATTDARSDHAGSATAPQRLTYMGAYHSREECDAAGRQFVGVDYFCYVDYNDGRKVWELWVESNRPS